jgi:hypothetical protein
MIAVRRHAAIHAADVVCFSRFFDKDVGTAVGLRISRPADPITFNAKDRFPDRDPQQLRCATSA